MFIQEIYLPAGGDKTLNYRPFLDTCGRRIHNPPRMNKLWRSGIIFSAASFITGIGNYAFQMLIGRRLQAEGEFGLANGTFAFISLLGLPLLIATTAVTHYIAHFRATDDQARLRGLLLGCRKFLFRLTIVGSLLAMAMVKPLSLFFNFSRSNLILVALCCVLAGLWGSFAAALCQGMAWFKRLAFIGLAGVGLRLAFTWFATVQHPVAEAAVLATGVAVLANLVLLYWRKELFRHGESVSPWDREFVQYLIVSAACVGGGFCFLSGDMLVAKRYFEKVDMDHYAAANKLAAALPMVVGPLLIVLFTSRSGERSGNIVREQLKLLGLYAAGLLIGAAGLLVFRNLCVKLIFGKESPEAADMIWRLATTMVFGGLLQALGMWALASRWLKVALFYGALGLCYWLTLLWFGKTPKGLLGLMPVLAGAAFAVLLATWMVSMRRCASASESR
jgi:O-antigen/teichoic acid export membrane protein